METLTKDIFIARLNKITSTDYQEGTVQLSKQYNEEMVEVEFEMDDYVSKFLTLVIDDSLTRKDLLVHLSVHILEMLKGHETITTTEEEKEIARFLREEGPKRLIHDMMSDQVYQHADKVKILLPEPVLLQVELFGTMLDMTLSEATNYILLEFTAMVKALSDFIDFAKASMS